MKQPAQSRSVLPTACCGAKDLLEGLVYLWRIKNLRWVKNRPRIRVNTRIRVKDVCTLRDQFLAIRTLSLRQRDGHKTCRIRKVLAPGQAQQASVVATTSDITLFQMGHTFTLVSFLQDHPSLIFIAIVVKIKINMSKNKIKSAEE